jgi:hypothetical protein
VTANVAFQPRNFFVFTEIVAGGHVTRIAGDLCRTDGRRNEVRCSADVFEADWTQNETLMPFDLLTCDNINRNICQ